MIDKEFKNLIPPLLPEEREQLEQNILEARKCYDPIVLWNGVILDGHNRYEICVKHGIEFQIVDLPLASREEAIFWILDNQLSRRNLNDAARIEMALLKTDMLREKARKNQSRAGGDKKSAGSLSSLVSKPKLESIDVRKSTAEDIGISEGKLNNYMQIKEHGSPELLAKVKSSELKIGTAHRLLPKEILKQLNQYDKMLKFIASTKPAEGFKTAAPEVQAKLENIDALLCTLLEKLGDVGGKV